MRPDFGSGWKISYIYALKENYSEALEYIDSYITTAPSEGTRVHGYAWRGFLNCWLGNYEQSLDDLRQGEALGKAHGNLVWISNIIWMRGWLFYEMKEYELARICFKSKYDAKVGIASSSPLNKFFYYMDVGSVDFAQGRIDSANSKLEKMELLLPELDSHFEYTEKSRLDLFHCELLLAKGLAKRTIDYYRKATPIEGLPNLRGDYYFRYNTPFLKDVLARAYQKNGELDKAIEEYKKLINFDPNRKERLLIHPKYYYRLAILYEEKNLKGEAIEQYQRFLELWKDAIPGIVEVDDARERLARLNKP
jgi:tetratricopeptide (TPR) repeat protein